MVFSQEASRTWNSLIVDSAKSGKPHHALFLYYQRMQQGDQSVYPSNPTFVALLKACAKLKDIRNGVSIHAEVARMGLSDKNVFIGSVLVDMYAKSGSLARARQVFNRLALRNVVSWTSLIAGYVDYGDGQEALNLFERMLCDKVAPNCVTYVCILKACVSLRDIDRGVEIHAEIERQGLLERHAAVGNTLVDMYAKCGSISTAQEVFDKLPHRDAVTWTALVTGYVENGLGDEALCCFEEMQLESAFPDVFTFVVSLRACVLVGDENKGREIHAEIERQGLAENNIFIGSALIDMYGKLGLVDIAQEVFDRSLACNTVAWNALISGYVEHGYDKEALACFLQMKDGTIPADHVTFVCSLKACGQLGDTNMGKEIHAEIERQDLLERHLIIGYLEEEHDFEALQCFGQMQLEGVFPDAVTLACGLKACGNVRDMDQAYEIHLGIAKKGLLEQDAVLGSALMDMYAKSGHLFTAQRLLDMLPKKDLASWNALVTGYAEHGHAEKALECFGRMQFENVYPDAVTYVGSFKACACIGAFDIGIKLHSEVERLGLLEANALVGNALVDMYVKCGLLGFAVEVFDKLSIHDVVSWTALISGYVEYGLADAALNSLELMQMEGICASVASLVCGLKACAILGEAATGKELHAVIEKRGLLERDTGVGNSLVGMYAECGMLAIAQRLFDKLPDRDVVSWTALIARYAENGYCEEALECFEQMQHEGVFPDVVTFVCSLKACDGVRAVNKLKDLHAEIYRQQFFLKNNFVSNTLVDVYAKCGLLKKAREVFDKLPVKNIISWNILIAGYFEQGHGEEALGCLEEMQRKGISPDMVTFICCLQACGSIGAVDKGLEIHAEIERQGLLGGDLVGNTLVDMYAKCGSLARAQQLVDKLPCRDVVSWTALMRGYAHAGESENVFFAFNTMLKDYVKPDPITFIVLLSACSRAGLFNESWTYFEAMSINHGIAPTLEHHACVVDLLSRSGQLEEASETIERLPFSPSSVVWHSVLGACKNLGSLEFANEAFKNATHLNKNDPVAYILMSQTCAGNVLLEHANCITCE